MRARTASLILATALGAAYALGPASAQDATKPPAAATPTPALKKDALSFEKDIQPMLQKYCYTCHGNGNHKGDVALDSFKSLADIEKGRKTWETLLDKVRKHEMPPDDAEAQPSLAERDMLGDWVEAQLYHYDPTNPDPGHVTFHRLNRAEYNNSIRELTGVDFQPADDFPPDDSGYGFDNIGDVLSLPPMLFEKYLAAATKILDQAVATEPVPYREQRYPARFAEVGFNAIGVHEDGWAELKSLEEDDLAIEVPIPAPGDYLVRFQAYGTPTGGYSNAGVGYKPTAQPTDPETPKMSLRVGSTYIHQFEITTADKDKPDEYEWRVGVQPGTARFRVVMDRDRGGDNELIMLNGRIGKQQMGLGFIKWIEVKGPLQGATRRYPAKDLTATGENTLTLAGERVLGKDGAVSLKINVPKDGEYILRAYAYAQQAGDEPARMDLRLDGKPLQTFDVLAPAKLQILRSQRTISDLSLLNAIPQVYEIHANLTEGEKTFSAAFLNPFDDSANADPNLRQRRLTVQSLEVVNLAEPALWPQMPETMKRYFSQSVTPQNKTITARDIITQFTRRAWRRPPQPAEIDRLMNLFILADKQGDTLENGIKLAFKAVLVSPNFLFRRDSAQPQSMVASMRPAMGKADSNAGPSTMLDGVKLLFDIPSQLNRPEVKIAASPASTSTSAKPATAKLGVPIDEFSLASRLSYFLWSSTPDDELLNLAEHNQLRANLAAQVRRMLASPKSRALVDNFAAQWLQYRSLSTFEPDKKLFATFNPTIRGDMQTETEDFFDYIMRSDRSVMDFLTADYTFVNDRLASYYGLPDVTGEQFQKVSLKDTPRRGVLTQGSVLVLTSNPTRTSPVKRGKWVLENLLGTPPPPPPPNVPVLDEETQLTGTLRQQMEQHRANPICASCHARMDPIGFGLENFDAAGVWRSTDANQLPIDPSGTLVSGESFQGASDLVQILADKKRGEFLHCLTEKMLTYALGRGLEYYDRSATDQIVTQLEKNDDKFSVLVLGVVNSLPFQQMRGADANPTSTIDTTKNKVAAE